VTGELGAIDASRRLRARVTRGSKWSRAPAPNRWSPWIIALRCSGGRILNLRPLGYEPPDPRISRPTAAQILNNVRGFGSPRRIPSHPYDRDSPTLRRIAGRTLTPAAWAR